MASDTKKTENIRANKRKKAGRKRKNSIQNHGSTRSMDELFKDVADKSNS